MFYFNQLGVFVACRNGVVGNILPHVQGYFFSDQKE